MRDCFLQTGILFYMIVLQGGLKSLVKFLTQVVLANFKINYLHSLKFIKIANFICCIAVH